MQPFVVETKVQNLFDYKMLYSTRSKRQTENKDSLHVTEKTGSNLFSARAWASQINLGLSPVLALNDFQNE